MAYIGNARSLLLFAANVRDDITPGYDDPNSVWPQDGDFDKKTFELSQEVPGGYEQNVAVVQQKYKREILVTDTKLISLTLVNEDVLKLSCVDIALAASLASVLEPQEGFDGTQTLVISGSTNLSNNKTYVIADLTYDGQIIEILLTRPQNGNETESIGEQLSVTYGHYGPWEILDAEQDYTIGGTGDQYNRLIEFTKAPQAYDRVYVLHKGDATYNFVPSPNSVGPDQLSQNLRNFVCDRYTGDGTTTTFALSQDIVNARSVIVSVNGIIKEGNEPGITDGDWTLDNDRNVDDQQTITFTTAPEAATKIRILHLGFSTVSRRESLSPGQDSPVGDNSITSRKLAVAAVTTEKLAVNAVTKAKIANNQVSGSKILLEHGEALRSKQSSGSAQTELIKLESDATAIDTPTTTSFKVASVKKVNLSASEVSPETSAEISLGSSSKKFKELHLSGDLTVGGNITVDGTISGVGDLLTLRAELNALAEKVNGLIPVGTIMLWTKNTPQDSTWLLCDGSAVSRTTYATLYNQIGVAFGSGDGTTTFNLPDLRRRYAVGKGSADALGNSEGISNESSRALTHTHSGAAHTHDLGNHTHKVLKHYHHFGNLTNNNTAWDSGSTLAILSSGSHNTNIDIGHEHTASCARSVTGITINRSITNISAKTSKNGTNAKLIDTGHDHDGITGDFDASHQHALGASTNAGWDVPNDSDSGLARSDDSLGFSHYRRTTGAIVTGTNGTIKTLNHNHTIPKKTTGILFDDTAKHEHTVDITEPTTTINGVAVSGHLHTISEPTNTANGVTTSGHLHAITVNALPSTTKTDTGGSHTHATTFFTGRLGQVTGGQDGNTDVDSGAPSNNNTGSATYTGQSGAGVSPYLILNYVIKAL